MNRNTIIDAWKIEDRLALVPVIGKAVAENLPRPDLLEEKLRFGDHPQQILYLCMPEESVVRRRSAVLFLHGGGWNSGSPYWYRFVGHFFAGLGYPTLVGGYRLAPESRHPDQSEDIGAGLEAGLQAFDARGVELERVIVGGQSAGAQLAALLAYDRDQPVGPLARRTGLGGFFSISGPLNFSVCHQASLVKMIDDYTGDAARRAQTDPIRHLRGDERIPALLIHGDEDPLVEVENSITFASRLARSRSAWVELHLVRGGHHADLAALFLNNLSATQTLVRWLGYCDRH